MINDDLDDLVDLWHNSPDDGVPLHEFLGMTWDEYKAWTENPATVPPRFDGEAICRARRDIAILLAEGLIPLDMAMWAHDVVDSLFDADTVYACIAAMDGEDVSFYWVGGSRSIELDLFEDGTCWMSARNGEARFRHHSTTGEISDWMRVELADFSAAVEAANPAWREQTR